MSLIKNGLIGFAVGDAMGVPIEFKNREELLDNPVTSMIDGGTYGLPAGTFSDDTSKSFCPATPLSVKSRCPFTVTL